MEEKYTDSSSESTLTCPLRYIQDLVGGKWKMPILCILSKNVPLRNSAIKRKLQTITNATLSQSLKELEAAGLIHREQFNEVPPHVEYTLTPKGETIISALAQLGTWAIEDMKSTELTPSCASCSSTL